MTTTLPPRLRERLDALACRVRRLRRLRGGSLLVLSLTCCAASAVLADLALTLPPVVRAIDLALSLFLGAAVAFVCLIRPLRQKIDPADLAAVVERQYPDLQERLTTSVELASAGAPPAGLAARLLSETDERTRSLDFDAAVPARPARRLGIAAAVVAALALAPAAFAPGEYGRLAARFFAPWRSPADFAFVVHPGDVVAARGRPLTVRATLVPRRPGIALPRYCSLVLDQTRLDLAAGEDDPASYGVTFPVVDSGRYRVEAGDAASPWHTLTAVTPTDLAPDSPSIVVTPPAEAASSAETQTLAGMVDVTAFANSAVAFRFAFDRPATAAVLEWTPEGKPAQPIPLPLAEEGRSATWNLSATQAGAYRLLITGEHGIETAREGGRVAVRPLPDQKAAPPELTKDEAEAKERIEDLATRQKELADRAAGAKTEEEGDEIARAQAELARELDRLAKDESALKDALEAALADRAKALAEDQRGLARAAEETERKHDAERLADVAKRQRALQKRAEALAKETARAARANFARPLNDEAGRAAESMERGDTQQALDAQDRAARDLDRLARDLDRLADAAMDAREAVRQLSRLQDDIAKRTREEAGREADAPLAERLKDLLREQEALRRAVRDLELPDRKAAERQAAAEKAMAKGGAKEALAAMESARLALRASANEIKAGDKIDRPPSLMPNAGQAKQAREMAAEQRALRQETKDAAARANRERRPDAPPAEGKGLAALREKQQAMQEALALRAGALAKELGKTPGEKEARGAEAAMRAAQAMAKQGNAESARAQREQAAKALERAASRMKAGKGGAAGQAVREARERMGRAGEQLGKGPPADASGPMQEAASRLRLAGRQLARSGSAPGVAADARPFPKELAPHVGKRWGDLPGDLRTRLVQQMRARYGDDYARSIKLYFEQLADTRRRP